ncbi:MAG: bifunctional methionine sulfoxide reductase B/A protein, partial [Bacteroidia bacterium]
MKPFKTYLPFAALFFWVIISACGQKAQKEKSNIIASDTSLMNKPDSFWKNALSEEQYYILREKGTERPYTGKWLLNEDSGVYTCSACGNELFTSGNKFDSHCGWPSFDEEIAGGKIITKEDNSHGMRRTEIMCANCGGHLGHLFDDGPTSTGKRYCVNSVSLEFVKQGELKTNRRDTLTLGGGCFWCIEAVFDQLKGVESVVSGYSGGTTENPSYYEVCNSNTGHAEVVQIIFNPDETNLEEIYKVFFTVHDPTQLNRQGADIGKQYRSTILYRNEKQKTVAEEIIKDLNAASVYDSPIVTTLE